MVGRFVGRTFGWLRDRSAEGLAGLGVRPNHLTVLGCLVTVAAGVLIALGYLRVAGVVIIAACACDILDGAVARAAGRKTPFGAFLDSSLDRIGDLAIFAGLAVHFARPGNLTYMLLSVVALGAAEVISYTRARAECLIESCKVGYWERPERMALIIVALVARGELLALWILATLPWFTVLHRMAHVRRRIMQMATSAEGGGQVAAGRRRGLSVMLGRVFCWAPRRASIPYDLVSIGILVLVVVLPLPETDPIRGLWGYLR